MRNDSRQLAQTQFEIRASGVSDKTEVLVGGRREEGGVRPGKSRLLWTGDVYSHATWLLVIDGREKQALLGPYRSEGCVCVKMMVVWAYLRVALCRCVLRAYETRGARSDQRDIGVSKGIVQYRREKGSMMEMTCG